MNQSLLALEQLISELDTVDKQRLSTLIEGQLSGQGCLDFLHTKREEVNQCPHCHSRQIKKYGKVSHRQRYRCNNEDCQRTFMCTYNTPFYRLRHLDKCLRYFKCMLDSLTIRKSAQRCHINKNTAFNWRHRFLSLMTKQGDVTLSGIIEMDETLFRYSEKGTKHLGRAAHKRGKDKAGRGRKKGDWVPVLIARDRENHVFDSCLETEKASHLTELFSHKIAKDSVLCSDGFRSYRVMAKQLNIAHKEINFSKGIRVVEKVFHIQNVNAYHGRLHNWMKRFHGVATKYLSNYLAWDRFFETRTNPNENNLLLAQTQLIQT
ncbi:IS1595 family transposase [Thalassotalea euphylliae]|uniref:IS1595 family transposase n=1 Tax=Thalassotalea euphylliae TaxID=1655234 RepID=A0A3E0TW30_9GAMM|nr:IS1595 family transposase [Thalassotalea euphylliae]REL28563.1 IS1595 family transposase [Thalassotalea euphylliae]